MTEAMSYCYGLFAVLSALYIAFSKNLISLWIAFFVELCSVSGLLLTLKADFLALLLFLVGLVSLFVLATFGGFLGDAKVEKTNRVSISLTQGVVVMGSIMLVVCFSLVMGGAFLNTEIHILEAAKTVQTDSSNDLLSIGQLLLREYIVVFELIAVIILLVVLGSAHVLRKPGSKNEQA